MKRDFTSEISEDKKPRKEWSNFRTIFIVILTAVLTILALYAFYSPNIIYFGNIVAADENIEGISLSPIQVNKPPTPGKEAPACSQWETIGEYFDEETASNVICPAKKLKIGITCSASLNTFPRDPRYLDEEYVYGLLTSRPDEFTMTSDGLRIISISMTPQDTVFVENMNEEVEEICKDKYSEPFDLIAKYSSACDYLCAASGNCIRSGVSIRDNSGCELDNRNKCVSGLFATYNRVNYQIFECTSEGYKILTCDCAPIVDIAPPTTDNVPEEGKKKPEGGQGGGTTVVPGGGTTG